MKENNQNNLTFFNISVDKPLNIPLVNEEISAGFPSPAQDFIESSIDLNKELIRNPNTTFYARINGDSMKDMGINSGDLVIIDKSLEPKNGNIAVCFIDGEFTMKEIKIEQNCCWLIPANKSFKSVRVDKDNDFAIWGIVIHVIKSF